VEIYFLLLRSAGTQFVVTSYMFKLHRATTSLNFRSEDAFEYVVRVEFHKAGRLL
jgi:hypothetical protein